MKMQQQNQHKESPGALREVCSSGFGYWSYANTSSAVQSSKFHKENEIYVFWSLLRIHASNKQISTKSALTQLEEYHIETFFLEDRDCTTLHSKKAKSEITQGNLKSKDIGCFCI
jgi:hypothetical protein